jgi:hypothetical protein
MNQRHHTSLLTLDDLANTNFSLLGQLEISTCTRKLEVGHVLSYLTHLKWLSTATRGVKLFARLKGTDIVHGDLLLIDGKVETKDVKLLAALISIYSASSCLQCHQP